MKLGQHVLILGGIFLFFGGIIYLEYFADPAQLRNELREDLAKRSEERYREMQIKEGRISQFYQRVDRNLPDGVAYMDSILQHDQTLDRWERYELHTIIGETLYDYDSTELALERFYEVFDSPRNQVNKAGCYVRMGAYNQALELLNLASEANHALKWYKGNLYEALRNREKAMTEYRELFEKDSIIYQYSAARMQEIQNPTTELYSELVYRNRRERTYLFLEPSGPNARGTEIGKLRIEKGRSSKP
ncbi:MAG: hypothetical protein AAF206_16595 [Bacteroidota bacterium]